MIGPVPKFLFLWAVRRRIRKIDTELDLLGRRMGLLRMGAATELFSTAPGLADIADGGVGARQALRAIEVAIESGSNLAPERVLETFEELDLFVADANQVLDRSERGRRKERRLFAPRRDVRPLF